MSGAQANDLSVPGPTYTFGTLGTGTVSGAFTTPGGVGGVIGAAGAGTSAAYTITFSSLLGAFGAGFGGLGTCCGGNPFAEGTLRLDFYNGATSVGSVSQLFDGSNENIFLGVAGLGAFNRVEVFSLRWVTPSNGARVTRRRRARRRSR